MNSNKSSKIISFRRLSFGKQILLILGIFCIIWGIFFIYLSVTGEQLDNGLEVKEVTEYIAPKPKLKIGEVKVTKSTEYTNDGIYKLTYKNYMNNSNNTEVLDKASGIQIVEVLGNAYTYIDNSININGQKYNKKSKIKATINGNVLTVDIPHEYCLKTNTIEIEIKLDKNASSDKQFTSRDSYYNFAPSSTNKFYGKKTSQSYLIDGSGYIRLKK